MLQNIRDYLKSLTPVEVFISHQNAPSPTSKGDDDTFILIEPTSTIPRIVREDTITGLQRVRIHCFGKDTVFHLQRLVGRSKGIVWGQSLNTLYEPDAAGQWLEHSIIEGTFPYTTRITIEGDVEYHFETLQVTCLDNKQSFKVNANGNT